MSAFSFMSSLGVLLFLSAFLIQGSLQQCVQNQTYNIIPAYNSKIDAPNVLRLAVIGTFIGNTSEFASNIVRFAAERINNDTTLLPDTRIELAFLPNTAIDLSSNLLLTLFAIQDLKVHGIIGGLSTTESRVIQLAAKLYNVPQLSSHGVGAVLSNKEEYPYYACIQPFDTIQISAIIAQFEYFKWTRGVILYSDNDYGAGYTGLVSQGAQLGIQFVSFSISSSATSTDAIAEQMNIIKNQIISDRYRIIVLYLTAQSTAYVMSLAHELGLVNDQFVYILSTNAAGVYTQRLRPDVLPYLKGSLGVILPVPAGPFYQQEFDAYKEVQAQNPTNYIAYSPRNQFFWSIYDTVLAYAHAVDSILKDGTLFGNMKGAQLYQQILKTTFYGTTGDLAFTPKGDRLGFYSITNFQNNVSVEVAQYSSRTNNISATRDFVFYGGTTSVPSDGTVTSRDGYVCKTVDGAVICERDYILREYSKGLAGGLGAIIGVGVLVALFAIVMLVLHWKIYISKYGTFYCAVILTGVLTSYVAAFSLLPDPTDALCVVFPWFLGIAFTLVYGCLFIKAWILYRLWRYALQLKRMSITALTVVKYVGAALCVEIILLIIWTVVDPPRVRLIKMVDHSLQPQCQSDTPIFWVIFLCLKGVWLLFGVVVSVLTRTVVKEYQNFTEFTYAMYNILIMVIIAVPLGLLLEEVPNGVLIVSVVVIVLAFLFSTVILFFNIWYSLLYSDKLSISSNLSAHKSSPSQSKISGGSSSSRSHV